MATSLIQYLNKTILVSIPALFDDGACRPYKLVSVELPGLWLQSEELSKRLLAHEQRQYSEAAPVVFVPFAQIAGVLVTTGPPPQTLFHGSQKPHETSKAHTKDAEKHASSRHAEERTKPKRR